MSEKPLVLSEHALAGGAPRDIDEATVLEVAAAPSKSFLCRQAMCGLSSLTIVFRDVPVAESDEDKPGVILDYDAAGNLISIEILDASMRVQEPRSVTLATHG